MGEPALKSVEERTEEAILVTKAAFSESKRGPEVVRIDHKVGADWTGDDAIHFIVLLRDPVGSDGTALLLAERGPAHRIGCSGASCAGGRSNHTPYFRFQLESEQKAISRGSYYADEEEWVYRATRSKAPFDVTQGIALHDGFLCRSLHTKAMQRVANVKNVKIGDIIHFYYRAPSWMEPVGSFQIVDGWKASGRFSGPLPGHVAGQGRGPCSRSHPRQVL